MGKKEFIKIIEKFAEKLRKDLSVNNIIFFGSRTSNKYHKDSDIDLMIVSKDFDGMHFINRASKMYNYWESDMPVDFICYTPKEFEILKKKISIVRDALSQGIIIKPK